MTSRGKSTPAAELGAITVADRLRQARRRRFVGRTGELELFRTALTSGESGFTVLFVHGPGGIGKTDLARRSRRGRRGGECHGGAAGRPDDRAVAARVLRRTRRGSRRTGTSSTTGEPRRALPRPILFIDTYEQLMPLDNWLREEFLPALPADALVVVAGRTPPSPQWASDPGWGRAVASGCPAQPATRRRAAPTCTPRVCPRTCIDGCWR